MRYLLFLRNPSDWTQRMQWEVDAENLEDARTKAHSVWPYPSTFEIISMEAVEMESEGGDVTT